MKKIKNLILAILIMALPILAGMVAEIISKIITIEIIMKIVYIAIPVLIIALIKNK